MNFSFDIAKATEAAGQFIKQEGGEINIMKLVKLIYLLDRLSMQRRGIPVVGGVYFSMPNGPVTSEILNLINEGYLWEFPDCRWDNFISDREDHKVELIKDPGSLNLSKSEIDMIQEIYKQHGEKSEKQIVEWCHENCREWSPLQSGRKCIDVESLAVNLGKTKEEAELIKEEAREWNLLVESLG